LIVASSGASSVAAGRSDVCAPHAKGVNIVAVAPSDNNDDVNTEGEGVQRLGRYTLVRRLGKGGMGEVFLAKSSGARGFEKQVAIKRILPQYSANKHVVNMLVDEARICVLLNHPNVVQVLELDEDEGSHFIVMEYVDGHALSRLIRRLRKRGERVEALVACFVMIGVLEGLHAAHTQKDNNGDLARIIHRDVSPQNVLLSMTGQIKVIDFGIARARDRLEATQGSQVKGKLRYMAPEQIKPSLAGSAGIDHRVDVFAAGVVLFEMLAMRQRFPQTADLEIIDAILEEETPDLRNEAGGVVDDELQAILHQALAKERKKRFKDAGAFAAALRGYLYARDPAFTADRLGRLMRRCFTDEAEEPDEEPAPAPVVKKGKVTVKSMPERAQRAAPTEPEPPEQDDVTRTQMRPRVAADAPPARRQRAGIPAPILGALIGAVVLIVCGLLVKSAMKPQQLPVDGPVITSLAVPAAGLPTSTKGLTPAPLSPGSPAPRSDGSLPPPERNARSAPAGLVDFGSGLELIVEAIPNTARISLAYQPDPKYVSPARLKVQRGETVDLIFEAEGYESSRRQFVAEGPLENGNGLHFEVKLVPIPMPLIVRPVPRDAEVLVNGNVWRSGKVNPGDELVINARHPFYVEKTVTVTAVPGQSVIVDITLDEKPPEPVDANAPDDFDKGLERIKGASKGKKSVVTGVLVVTSKPLYADVFVDGKKLISSTPVRESVTAGSHKVTVRGKNAEKTFVVDVPAGGTIKKDIVLE
jgi:serine/threonine protein kinase